MQYKSFIELPQNMINKINKERRRSITVTPHDPATRASGKEPRRTSNKPEKQKEHKLVFFLCIKCTVNYTKISL
jgi:hypothetical protein